MITGLPAHFDTPRPRILRVDTLLVAIVDISRAPLPKHRNADTQLVRDEWRIQGGIRVRAHAVGVCLLRYREASISIPLAQVRLVRDVTDHAGHTAGPECRALGPLQHLNTRDIVQPRVQLQAYATFRAVSGDVDLIQIDADRTGAV